MSASSPRRSGALGYHSDRVYVHAKVGIVDDRWLTLGSANLNGHSFFSDSEVNVVTCDAALVPTPDRDCGPPSSNATLTRSPATRSTVVDELWRRIGPSSPSAATPVSR